MSKGVFIAFEGIDGSGKTEQVFRLAHWLFFRSKKFTSLLATREPTNMRYGREVRRRLHAEKNPFSNAEKFLQLYVKDRREHWSKEIKPALREGAIVLCDRFKHSSYAFQQTQGIPLQRIIAVHKGIPSPDLVLLIDVPAEEAFERLGKRKLRGNEKFERLEFMRLLRRKYLELPKLLPKDNIAAIDGTGSREQVFERVKKAVLESGVVAGII